MRIGFYHDNVGTKHAGGISVYSRQLAIALAEENEVYVYTQDGDVVPELAESAATIVETPAFDVPTVASPVGISLPVGPQSLSKLAMITWSARNDVIDHIDSHVDVLVTVQIPDDLLLSNLTDVPTVYGFLSDGEFGIGTEIRERYTRTNVNFAISPYLAERVAEAVGYEVDGVVLPGLEVDRFHPDTDPAFEADSPTILFVGRVVEKKGIFDLLEAVAALEDDVHLRVVGTGGAEEEVRRRSRKLGIGENVTLEGELPHEELSGYYAAADVFCLPTHVDSFAMVNLEAMGCGTPVVTTDLEGVKTYLEPGKNGVVVPSEEPAALARALADVLTDPGRRRGLGVAARRTASEFSWNEQAGRLEELCVQAVARGGKRRSLRSRLSPV